jgi:nucleotide-binding universal stress UspA family protein
VRNHAKNLKEYGGSMLDHILIPLDGSKLAEEAVAYGKQILPKGGKITLITALHVSESWMYGVDPLVVSAEYRRSIDQMEQSAKAYLQRIAVGLEADGFQVATLLEYGHRCERGCHCHVHTWPFGDQPLAFWQRHQQSAE